jgi:mono/diheme cytochrome c family protein
MPACLVYPEGMKALIACSVLAAPLLLWAQQLPEGKGKELVAEQCAACHGLEQVVSHRDSKDGWESVVAYMVSRGMPASNDEVKIMVEYLAAAFPKDRK